MSLKALFKSLNRDEVLLSKLRAYLLDEHKQVVAGKLSRKAGTLQDARMTVKCMRARIEEYNHGAEEGDVVMFHPSQIGVCLRQLFFAHTNAPQDGLPLGSALLRSHMTFENGTYTHVLFQNLCERAGVLSRREIAIIDRKKRILGHADGQLTLPGFVVENPLLEIKTINSRGFAALSEPKHEHKMQATLYMWALSVKGNIFVYLEKDRHEMKEFFMPYDVGFLQRVVLPRMTKFFDHLDAKTLPAREGESIRAFPCMYCPYKKVCFNSPQTNAFEQSLKSNASGKSKSNLSKKSK